MNPWSATTAAGPWAGARVTVIVLHVGARADVGDTEVAAYTLVHLNGGYALTLDLDLTARIENLADEEYQEVKGFGAPGRAFYTGIEATF